MAEPADRAWSERAQVHRAGPPPVVAARSDERPTTATVGSFRIRRCSDDPTPAHRSRLPPPARATGAERADGRLAVDARAHLRRRAGDPSAAHRILHRA